MGCSPDIKRPAVGSSSLRARAGSGRRRLAALLVALASTGSVALAQQPGADSPSKALEGRWTIELYLGTPSARTTPLAGQINGEIAFGNTAWWNPTDRFGRHSLNLQSFFGNSFLRPANVTPFGNADTSMVTEVSGNVRHDSVSIDFIPRIDHGGISMRGLFWGDSAKGTWRRRGTDGDGRFVLRRVSKDPVSVAAIPDGRPAPVAVAAVIPATPLTKAQLRAQARADAAAKIKADALARTHVRDSLKAQALELAKAKAAARDSAKAQTLAAAQAKVAARDSAKAETLTAAQAKVAARKAARDSIRAQAVAAAEAKKAARAETLAAAKARKDSLAGARLAARTAKRVAVNTPTAFAANARPNAAGASAVPNATAAPATGAASATAAAGPPGAATPGTAGALRVRIFDEASKKYFVTTYSLHLPDGHWMYGRLRTGNGPDGFGPPVPRPPGSYEIEIANFMCGDKLWFLKDKILKPVVVEAGAPADVSIEINLPTVPARPSIDNKTGAACTAEPVAAR